MQSDLGTAFDATLLSRVEDAGLNASAPPQQLWIDGWLVRFSPGKARRARCVNAVSHGRLSIDQRLQLCRNVFARAGLPFIVRVTPFTAPGSLDALLDQQGMHQLDETRVMVLPHLPEVAAALPAGLSIEPIGLEAFAQRVGALRGSPLAHRQSHALRLRHAPVDFHAFELRAQGQVVACGQFALEGELAGIYDVFTAPQSRRQGHAGVLCHHLAQQARARGAGMAYLQVAADNPAAISVYAALGFKDAYRYHYRAALPDEP
jgi:ribosomal protein S18 acetylase RimI-like enzyme